MLYYILNNIIEKELNQMLLANNLYKIGQQVYFITLDNFEIFRKNILDSTIDYMSFISQGNIKEIITKYDDFDINNYRISYNIENGLHNSYYVNEDNISLNQKDLINKLVDIQLQHI